MNLTQIITVIRTRPWCVTFARIDVNDSSRCTSSLSVVDAHGAEDIFLYILFLRGLRLLRSQPTSRLISLSGTLIIDDVDNGIVTVVCDYIIRVATVACVNVDDASSSQCTCDFCRRHSKFTAGLVVRKILYIYLMPSYQSFITFYRLYFCVYKIMRENFGILTSSRLRVLELLLNICIFERAH